MRTFRTWLVLAPALVAATACSSAHWGYTGAHGPEHWGDTYVLFNEGARQPTIDTIWRHLPTRSGEQRTMSNVVINAAALLPPDRSYYAYMGSLTVPPCSEGVRWHVLKTPLSVSTMQINTFPFGMNARPVQPLNGRVVEEVSPR